MISFIIFFFKRLVSRTCTRSLSLSWEFPGCVTRASQDQQPEEAAGNIKGLKAIGCVSDFPFLFLCMRKISHVKDWISEAPTESDGNCQKRKEVSAQLRQVHHLSVIVRLLTTITDDWPKSQDQDIKVDLTNQRAFPSSCSPRRTGRPRICGVFYMMSTDEDGIVFCNYYTLCCKEANWGVSRSRPNGLIFFLVWLIHSHPGWWIASYENSLPESGIDSVFLARRGFWLLAQDSLAGP